MSTSWYSRLGQRFPAITWTATAIITGVASNTFRVDNTAPAMSPAWLQMVNVLERLDISTQALGVLSERQNSEPLKCMFVDTPMIPLPCGSKMSLEQHLNRTGTYITNRLPESKAPL